jgi:hypothetical protein
MGGLACCANEEKPKKIVKMPYKNIDIDMDDREFDSRHVTPAGSIAGNYQDNQNDEPHRIDPGIAVKLNMNWNMLSKFMISKEKLLTNNL